MKTIKRPLSPHEYLEPLKLKDGEMLLGDEYFQVLERWNFLQPRFLRAAAQKSKPHELAHELACRVTKFSAELILPAFAGDVDAAGQLSVTLDNCERGAVAYAMWKARVSRDAFRAYFTPAWEHDHRWVIQAAGSRATLSKMFGYAAFDPPDHLPETVRVWRGTSHLTRKQAQSGYSWTTERDIACWFAVRHAGPNDRLMVLAADVPRRDIALYHDGRKESEAVLLTPPDAWIDSDVNDWRIAFERHQKKVTAQHRKWFPSVVDDECMEGAAA